MASTQTPFQPLWASPPGHTIRDALEERSISVSEFAGVVDLTRGEAEALLGGRLPMTINLAARLEGAVGATAEFWMNRDCQYRDDLERVELERWLTELPIKEMERLGWISETGDRDSRGEACLRFFGVGDAKSLEASSSSRLSGTRFRKASDGAGNPFALFAWIRRAENQAGRAELSTWDPAGFEASLPDLKRLTRSKDPSRFLPRLRHLCASSGVAVELVQAPRGSAVSGAAFFADEDRPVIALSARYLSDDHFWFTFFHEAAHLLKHDASLTYVDDEVGGGAGVNSVEDEANAFASKLLVPDEILASVPSRRLLSRDVIRMARAAGTSPGVVVGQLQHRGILGFHNLNGLKRRYRWAGPTLEMA